MKKVRENNYMATQKIKNKKNIKRKKSNLLIYKIKLILSYCAIFLIISTLCLFISFTILFKIKEIVVQGDSICDAQVLIEKSGIKYGDNLFFVNTNLASARIESEIPNTDSVTMIKKFPSKLIINVKKADKMFDIEFKDDHIYINSKGKVIEVSKERDESLILLKGINLEPYEIGKKIKFLDDSLENNLLDFVEKMNLNGLTEITEINFNNGSLLMVNYNNRIKINFGFYEGMDYKIKTAAEIINNRLGTAEKGVLDLSEVSKENRSYFTLDY